jgi:2-C-methyl-D-erythritol 4-phosphate cytidylyltransferase
VKVWGVIPASGEGKRMGGPVGKQFVEVGGVSILSRTLKSILKSGVVSGITVVVREESFKEAEKTIRGAIPDDLPVEFAAGGKTRQESVYRGLLSLKNKDIEGDDLVLIHDAARPFISPDIVKRSVLEAEKTGATVVAIPATDATVVSDDEFIFEYLPRDRVFQVQTPQVFRYDLIVSAYEKAERDGIKNAVDCAQLVLRLGQKVKITIGSPDNIKITYKSDLVRAEAILKEISEGKSK